MHLHFERIEKPSSYCDCPIVTLSWMGKVPDVSIGKEEGWKLNRHQYYTDGWLASGNIRGIIGCTFTTCSCRNACSNSGIASTSHHPSVDCNIPLRTNYNLRGHRSEVTIVKWNEPYQKLATCDSSGIIFVWIKYEGRWSIELINDRSMPVVDFNWSHDGRMALICYIDGFILVGSVTGQRYWSSMININDVGKITSGIWTPDDSYVLFATNIGYIIVINVNGTMVNQIKIRPSAIAITSMSWSCEKFKMDDTDDQQQQSQSQQQQQGSSASLMSIAPFTIGSNTSSSSSSSSSSSASSSASARASSTANNNSMINSKNGLEYILAVCFIDGLIYLMKNYDDIVPIVINVNLINIKMEWSNNGDVLAVAGHHIIKKQQQQPASSTSSAAASSSSNCCSICCGGTSGGVGIGVGGDLTDDKQSTSALTSTLSNLMRHSMNRFNRTTGQEAVDDNCNDTPQCNESNSSESECRNCNLNHATCPHRSSAESASNIDLYVNQMKFYTPNGKLRYSVKVNFNLSPITAITWGHNDKRIFIATGPVLHIAWITKKVPTLQLLSRLTIFKSLSSEHLIKQLRLPSRIEVMISSLFSRTLRCYLPSVSTLRSYVSNPPLFDTRLYCTLIRHDDDLIGGSTTYVLYLEYLGGLVPILKGKRASKLKPEFVIYDPQPVHDCCSSSNRTVGRTTSLANNSLDKNITSDTNKLPTTLMNYTSNEIVNYYPNTTTSIVSSSASSSGYSSSSRRNSSHDDLDVNKTPGSVDTASSAPFNISCSPFSSRKFVNNVSVLTNLPFTGKHQANSQMKANKSFYWKCSSSSSPSSSSTNAVTADASNQVTSDNSVTTTDTESESESILTDEYGHIYSLPSPIMRRKCRRKRRGPVSGQAESNQRNNQQQQQHQAAVNVDGAIDGNNNAGDNIAAAAAASTSISPIPSEMMKAESTYLDEMPENVKLILVTSNIWGTKFKIIGLVSWLPSILGTVSYRTSVLHLQPRQMTLQIKELGGRRSDARSYGSTVPPVATTATTIINDINNLRSNLSPSTNVAVTRSNSIDNTHQLYINNQVEPQQMVISNQQEAIVSPEYPERNGEVVNELPPPSDSIDGNNLTGDENYYTSFNKLPDSIHQCSLDASEWPPSDRTVLSRNSSIDADLTAPTAVACQIATIAPMTPRKTAMRQRKTPAFLKDCAVSHPVCTSSKFTSSVNDEHFERDDKSSLVNCSIDTSSSYPLHHHASSSFASPRASDELLAQIARQLAAEYSASTVSETNDFHDTLVTCGGGGGGGGGYNLEEAQAEHAARPVIHKRCTDVKKNPRPVRKGSPGRPLQYPLNLSLPPSNDTLDQYVNGTYSFTNDVPSTSFTSTGHVATVTSPLTAINSTFIDNEQITFLQCENVTYNGVPLIPITNEMVSSDIENYSNTTATAVSCSGVDSNAFIETLEDNKFTLNSSHRDTACSDVSSSTVSSLANSSSIDTTSPDTSSTSSSVSSSRNLPDGQFMKLLPTGDISSDVNADSFMYPRLRLKGKACTSSCSSSQNSRKRDRHVSKYLTNVRSINGVIQVENCSHDDDSSTKNQQSDESYFNCTYFDCYDDEEDDDEEDEVEETEDEDDRRHLGDDINMVSTSRAHTSGSGKLTKKSKYRRSSCHCERAILDQQGNNKCTPEDTVTYSTDSTNDAYRYHTSSFLNDCIVKCSSKNSANSSSGNNCTTGNKSKSRSQYNSTSNIFSTPVHRSNRQRAMDYRTYESLMALDSLINEARQAASYRSHSTLGQYSSQTRDQIDINDVLVYNVHTHATSSTLHEAVSPLSACTSPLPVPLSLSGLTFTTGSTSAVNQCMNAASASTDLSHHSRTYQPSSIGHVLSKRSANYLIKQHKASYPSHMYTDAITLVPVSSDTLNTSKILQGTSNNVSRYTSCNENNVDATTTAGAVTTVSTATPTSCSSSSYTGRRSSLQMINVDVDCTGIQCAPTAATAVTTTAASSIVGESSHNHNCISGRNVPSSSVDCDTLYTNSSTRATAISHQQQHRSLPASPSLEQSRRFISNLFGSNSGASRRNDNRRSGGRSLLSSPRMLKKVIKQKLNYLDCSSSESELSDDDTFSMNRDFLETLQRSKINGKLSNSSSVLSSIVNTGASHGNNSGNNNSNQQLQQQSSPVNGSNLLKKHFTRHTSKHRRGSRVQPEVEDALNSPGHINSRRRQEEQLREFVLQNKAPFWNELSQVYQLDFGGRVTQESAKNFQIEYQGNQVMQFGRIDGNAYTLDFQYPFCALQALAVALANVTQRLK